MAMWMFLLGVFNALAFFVARRIEHGRRRDMMFAGAQVLVFASIMFGFLVGWKLLSLEPGIFGFQGVPFEAEMFALGLVAAGIILALVEIALNRK